MEMNFTMQCVRRTDEGFVRLVMRGDYKDPQDEEVDIEPGELLEYSIRWNEANVLFWPDDIPDNPDNIVWMNLPGVHIAWLKSFGPPPRPPLPRSLVKEQVSWDFYEKAGRGEESYHDPREVLHALQALYHALKEHDEQFPKYYCLVSLDGKEVQTLTLQISGHKYEIACGWDSCYARREDGRIFDLRDKPWVQGLYQGYLQEFAVKAKSFFQIYGEGHLRAFMEVCHTALRHGWWVETYFG